MQNRSRPLLPLFLDLTGRRVLLVGGGAVAAAKLTQLLHARAEVRVVAPDVCEDIERSAVAIERRGFEPSDLDGVWLVVAAATPDVNEAVAEAAEPRHVFVNAVDDPAHASAFLSGVVRRDGVTLAISTSGAAPGLTALLREALDTVLPVDLKAWVDEALRQRAEWKQDGVPMSSRRPLLLEALNKLYHRRPEAPAAPTRPRLRGLRRAEGSQVARDRQTVPVGHVALVGAGPGSPGLLTRQALAALRAADLVLYDALIDPAILKFAHRAQRFFVGKRAGRHAMSQHAVNGLMIRAARRGKRVVRLKGGDPFVFGRGGEEALALSAAGVGFTVVPGVSSAVAAPALAGIPLTHRGISSALLIVGGHDEEAFAAAVRDVRPNETTLIIMMGVSRRTALARRLVESGWRPVTPAAIIVAASRENQSVWRGTIDDLASGTVEIRNDGPGTIVVGEVVALSMRAAGLGSARQRGLERRRKSGIK